VFQAILPNNWNPESGERVSEKIYEIPTVLIESLLRYVNVRSASPDGWLGGRNGLLVTTRFGDTDQVHWVHAAGCSREQLTFYDEPVNEVVANQGLSPLCAIRWSRWRCRLQ
jgi:hypothetical protein